MSYAIPDIQIFESDFNFTTGFDVVVDEYSAREPGDP